MVRAAMIGLGNWGRTLLGSVQGKSSEIQFVAGHARNRTTAEPVCKSFGIDYLERFEDVLSRKDIDAVVLATPHTAHVDQIVLAAAAGKHVFVEKPLALDSAGARRAVKAATDAKITLAVGFNRRFHPSFVNLNTRVHGGALGTIGTINGELTVPSALFSSGSGWRVDPKEVPAGAMTGLGIHLLDCMIGLAGPIHEVHCISVSRLGKQIEDTTNVLLAFKNGICGHLQCSLASAASCRLAVFGSKGIAEITGGGLDNFRFAAAPEKQGTPPAPPEIVQTPGFDMANAELNAFAVAAAGGAPYPVPIDDVVHGVDAFTAMVKSAATGHPVLV